MVDTLSNTSQLLHNFSYRPGYEYETKSTTEPDNGHKTETLTKLDFKEESVRLQSFRGWPTDVVKPQDLAKAGFYFLNHPTNRDLVRCAYCNAEICRWEIGDVPFDEHKKWAPNCPFVREHNQTSNSLSFLRTQESGQDVCGNAQIYTNSIPESETFRLLNNVVRKNYDEEKVRLESFATWPKSLKQKPADMAAAGFYYLGIEDHTVCFSCNGALKDWKENDDPWEQHALWFSRCQYVAVKKGAEYVKEVKRKFQPEVPSETKEEVCNKSASEEKSPSPGDGVMRCTICDTNERNMMLIPCRHILACETCSERFENCPICRQKICNKLKVFLS